MLWDLLSFDETPSPPPPTELDEINYQGLRFWFIGHESQFRPLWRDFYRSQDWVLRPDGDLIAEIRDAENDLEKASSCWYGPENLYQLVHALDIQSGIDIWEPSEHRAWTAMMDLLQMSTVIVEFYTWINERTEMDVTKEPGADILVVDHEEIFLEFVSRLLADEGYEVDTSTDVMDALEKIRRKEYGVLLTGFRMPGMDFFELYERVKAVAPFLAEKTIFIDAGVDRADIKEFLAENNLSYMGKPFSTKELVNKVNRMLTEDK